MEKNTVWAIVLSTLVIIASFAVQPLIFKGKNQQSDAQTSEVEATNETNEETSVQDLNSASVLESAEVVEEKTEEEKAEETKYTVSTNIADIVLTDKGGDIVSYKFKNHLDKETNDGVELIDNISATNRACGIAIGSVDNKILNDIFDVEVIDDYTILFKKKITKNGQTYTLGKKYSFKPDEYVFKLDVLIHNENGEGLDDNGVAYTIRTSPQVGPHYDPKMNRYENRQFVTRSDSKYKKAILTSGQFKKYDKPFIWNGIAGKYFIELMIPQSSDIGYAQYYSSQVEVDNYANAQAFIERKAYHGSDIQDTYYMYYGTRNEKDLKRYNVPENNGWGIGGYRINEAIQTYSWLKWLETILKIFMELIYKVIPNWGVAIIILTIILKILMFPISKNQSMSTLKMSAIQPKIQAIQTKYKNDPQKLQTEMSKVYKEAGYNPASGCLPMIIQFLVLFAMYDLFNNYFEFRGAMFIPHWIPDLSTGDSIVTFKANLPFIGNQLRLLPIIYVASQLLFGKITQNGGMTQSGQNAASMKFMTYGMPILFFFLFYNAPAGLLLYWTVSNIFQIGQQIVINRMMKNAKADVKADTKKIKGKK